MTTYDIHVAITSQLADNAESQGKNRKHARDIAEEYIEGAFSNVPNDSCSVTVGSEVYAPQQEVFSSFETVVPCSDNVNNRKDYPDLSEWWKDHWTECSRDPSAYDAIILITNYGGGGGLTIDDKYATVADGAKMLDVSNGSYQQYKSGEKYYGPWVLLHELGHALLKKSTSWEHNSGGSFYSNGTYFRSPFAADEAKEGDGSHYNECGEYVAEWDTNSVAMKWNDCAYEAFY
ncbi:hypothetical protein PNQ92_06695 [Halobacterium salinarum]|uniref:hypothetical protein n=1 Tax=Halobacterium salinarum TaxID=2242 RepID=UPI00255759DA|nr:hypothetical protein [Halobacterium salinarum]MDL0125098.1 hypothetical protein [Halobacterium salinarum]